jgi:hypothetical protein
MKVFLAGVLQLARKDQGMEMVQNFIGMDYLSDQTQMGERC